MQEEYIENVQDMRNKGNAKNCKELYIIRGIPGSGKTTFANRLMESFSNLGFTCCHYEADQFFETPEGYMWNPSQIGLAHKTCFNNIRKAFMENVNCCIVSNTFTTHKEMQPYIDLADEFGYNVHVYRIVGKNYGDDTFSKREQFADFRNVHDVPDAALDSMVGRFMDYPGEKIFKNENT